MLKIIYSNDLNKLAEQLNNKLMRPLSDSATSDPFHSDTILIQSQGMARWLNLELAARNGICANLNFELFSAFLWKQYSSNLFSQEIREAKDWFNLENIHWLTFIELEKFLDDPDFVAIKDYLSYHQDNYAPALFELSAKIAKIFDELLVYRPAWIKDFSVQDYSDILKQIIDNKNNSSQINNDKQLDLLTLIKWQAKLWCAVSQHIYQINQHSKDRADLFFSYLELLQQKKPHNLPDRLFIFGINALTNDQLNVLNLMAQYIEINLFFHNPCQYFWGDIIDEKQLSKIKLKNYQNSKASDYYENHPLLASFGKLGRDFFAAIQQLDYFDEEEYYQENHQPHLLAQIKNSILNLTPEELVLSPEDSSIQFHSCYSPMREVMALHDYLLNLFLTKNQDNETLAPRDIVVMVPDIDKYKPYIDAVFAQYKPSFKQSHTDKRFLDYAVSDCLLINQDIVINSFISLLSAKNSNFSFDEVWELLSISAIHKSFDLSIDDLSILKIWMKKLNLGAGLEQNSDDIANFSSWQTALNRILLGTIIREQDGLWHDLSAFDDAYGLSSLLAGKLYNFISQLQEWQNFIKQQHSAEKWHNFLTTFCNKFYLDNEDINSLNILLEKLDKVFTTIKNVNYTEDLPLEIIKSVISQEFKQEKKNANFLVGKINLCTMLPMRAIPFDTICLLGMGDGFYPRDYPKDSFNLLNYHFQYGDRVRRDDDFYLFLEAILSAKNNLYISYVGNSIKSNDRLEPSILVSELTRYIEHNLADKSLYKQLFKQHCLSPFNPDNFEYPNKSWAYEWLGLDSKENLAEKNIYEKSEKSVAVNNDLDALPYQIIDLDLEDLANFVAEPVSYFFQKVLYIRKPDFKLANNSEIIITSPLESYALLQDYIKFAAEQGFSKTKIDLCKANFIALKQSQAKLGMANIGLVNFKNILNKIKIIQKMDDFYTRQSEIKSCNFSHKFLIDNQSINLSYNINNIYEQQQYSFYNSNIKDKHIVRAYIIALIGVMSANFEGIKLICKDKECDIKPTLDKQGAEAILALYISEYLKSQKQVLLCPGFRLNEEFDGVLTKLFSRENTNSKADFSLVNEQYYWSKLYSNTKLELFLQDKAVEIEQNYSMLYQDLISLSIKVKNT